MRVGTAVLFGDPGQKQCAFGVITAPGREKDTVLVSFQNGTTERVSEFIAKVAAAAALELEVKT